MAKIRILTDHVANQIAAGEVIERPAAVVKELMENSLDAGAKRIQVEFRKGGKNFIMVQDDGCGMSPDDALLCLERHATSKIEAVTDILKIRSCGFRGEAMPSMASVSRFQLQTRTAAASVGTEIFVNGGKIVHQRECGMPVGTRVEVMQLFSSVPARRKFMKSDATEAAHIIHLVRLYALSHPGVAFELIEDDRMVFRSPPHTKLIDRISDIWKKGIRQELMPLETNPEEGMQLSGLIGKPGISRATRSEIVTFVNNRPVDSRTLYYAIVESYHMFIPKGKYPVAFLFLEMNPNAVDINVHPAKREVRFRDEAVIRQFIIRTLLERLQHFSQGNLPQFNVVEPLATPPQAPSFVNMPKPPVLTLSEQAAKLSAELTRTTGMPKPAIMPPKITFSSAPILPAQTLTLVHSFKAPIKEQDISANGVNDKKPIIPVKEEAKGEEVAKVLDVKPAIHQVPEKRQVPEFTDWKFLGTMKGHRALFETRNGLLALNYRAAHERVAYEKLQEDLQGNRIVTQQLLIPIELQLDTMSASTLEENASELKELGFQIDFFGKNHYRVEEIPAFLDPGEARSLVMELIALIKDHTLQPSKKDLFHGEFARIASSRALRKDSVLNEISLKQLLGDLFCCQNPLSCPKGRPTFIEWSNNDLDRLFQKNNT